MQINPCGVWSFVIRRVFVGSSVPHPSRRRHHPLDTENKRKSEGCTLLEGREGKPPLPKPSLALQCVYPWASLLHNPAPARNGRWGLFWERPWELEQALPGALVWRRGDGPGELQTPLYRGTVPVLKIHERIHWPAGANSETCCLSLVPLIKRGEDRYWGLQDGAREETEREAVGSVGSAIQHRGQHHGVRFCAVPGGRAAEGPQCPRASISPSSGRHSYTANRWSLRLELQVRILKIIWIEATR